MTDPLHPLALTAQITAAWVSNHAIDPADVPSLIHDVYRALTGLNGHLPPVARHAAVPQMDPKTSLFADRIVCIECGVSMTMLRRHLRTEHHLTPEQYRERWSLPKDYPMLAPDYSKTRSRLAKVSGLGKHTHRRSKR